MIRVVDTLSFVEKSNLVHNFKYDYSKSVYTRSKDKLEIICSEHGSFHQEARLHVSGKGCPVCPRNSKKDTNYFIDRSKKIHGDTYDYSKSIYVDRSKNVEIVCKIHGSFFQAPCNHYAGKGCSECGSLTAIKKKKKSFSEFINDSHVVHGDRYSYIEETYRFAKEKMEIVCRTHGSFKQTPNKHLAGQGCRECFNESRETIWSHTSYKEKCEEVSNGKSKLYLIRCTGNGEEFYKIGVSLHGAHSRFNSNKKMPYKFHLISEIELDAANIMTVESDLHKELKRNKYSPSLFFHGQTECFSEISREVFEFFGVQS